MKTMWMRWQPDRMESVVNGLMGLAVLGAVVGYFATMVQVADRAPSIARKLEAGDGHLPEMMIAVDSTNAPSKSRQEVGVGPQVLGTAAPLQPGA